MLRKYATREGKDWDKLVPYVLFAYQEVPQASTGFSLRLTGPRSPDVLRESWEVDKRSSETIISYVLSVWEKLGHMAELAGENLGAAQSKQKTWYDKKARVREFSPGTKYWYYSQRPTGTMAGAIPGHQASGLRGGDE